MPAGTSAIADHISVSGLLLNVSNVGSSPDAFFTVCNVSDLTIPFAATEVMVTNVSDTWVRRVPTLLDMGKIALKVFYVPEEPTHRNSVGGGGIAEGLMYMFVNKVLRDWQAVYPDGNSSTDAFSAYVTGASKAMKVGGVLEMNANLGTTGIPSLV